MLNVILEDGDQGELLIALRQALQIPGDPGMASGLCCCLTPLSMRVAIG
jgi:hypothetical protein